MSKLKVSIIKQGNVTNQAAFKTQEELDTWLHTHETMGSFGKGPYSYQVEDSPAVLDESGNVITEATYKTVEVPGEYEVVIEDCTAELEAEEGKKLKKRQLLADLKNMPEDNWKSINSIAECKKVIRALVDILEG